MYYNRGFWYFFIKTDDGKKTYISTKVKASIREWDKEKKKVKVEADKARNKILMEREYGTGNCVKQKKMKFGQFVEAYEKYAKSAKRGYETSEKYRVRGLVKYFGDYNLGKITSFHIEMWRKQRKASVTKNSVNREFDILSNIFAKAVEWGHISASPCSKVKKYKVPSTNWDYLRSGDDAKRLIEAAKSPLKEKIVIALHTGLRKGEINALKWSDIDFDEGVIKVFQSKTEEDKVISISDSLRRVLLEMKAKSGGSERLFRVMEHKRAWKTVKEKAGVDPNFRFHDLRHTFASWLAMSGESLGNISVLLGHKDLDMTARYRHLTPEYRKQAVNRIDEKMRRDEVEKVVPINRKTES